MDRGKDALAIRVNGDTPTSSWMLSREQEFASDYANQTALLPRYGDDLETPSSDNTRRPQEF